MAGKDEKPGTKFRTGSRMRESAAGPGRHRGLPEGNQNRSEGADRELAERVHEALQRRTKSTGVDVNVDAKQGHVYLSGTVDVLAEKTAAEEIASELSGVRGVENDLAVSMDGEIPDGEVEDRLSRQLAEAGLAGIGAEVRNGTVQLVGRARNQGAVEAALRLARSAPGVKNVYSSVRIEG